MFRRKNADLAGAWVTPVMWSAGKAQTNAEQKHFGNKR